MAKDGHRRRQVVFLSFDKYVLNNETATGRDSGPQTMEIRTREREPEEEEYFPGDDAYDIVYHMQERKEAQESDTGQAQQRALRPNGSSSYTIADRSGKARTRDRGASGQDWDSIQPTEMSPGVEAPHRGWDGARSVMYGFSALIK